MAREAAETLGYTKKSWDKGKDPAIVEECDWEEQVYRNFLKTVESKSKFAANSMLSDLRTFASQNML